MNETTEITLLPEAPQAVTLFAKAETVDVLIADIETRARATAAGIDATTAKGRSACASLAYQVARSKTLLDGMGKDLVADKKKEIATVDAERRKIRDRLDSLKDEVRKPLTEWETAEEARKAAIKARIADIEGVTAAWADRHAGCAADLRAAIDRIAPTPIDDSFAEFQGEAALTKDRALTTLRDLLAKAEAFEREQAEREAAEKAEAEARAKAEAEAAAKAEAERVEREKREAAERAEREKAEAEKREAQRKADEERRAREHAEAVERAKQEAAEAERKRLAAEEQARKDAEARRAADQEHRRKVNVAATEALTEHAGLTPEQARAVVMAVVNGQIPAISIRY